MNTSGPQTTAAHPSSAESNCLPLPCAFGAAEASDSIGGGEQKKNSNIYVSTESGEVHRLCLLVMMGARPDGTKELIAVEDGYRESAESWAALLRDLKRRGMRAPELAVGDGALGFWAAVRDVWPETREQRDWVHVIGNVLDKLPNLRPLLSYESNRNLTIDPGSLEISIP